MESKTNKGRMLWWQFSLIGVGCTIGTGFFLGSSMAIMKSGPAVLMAFLLAAIGTYIVYDALVKMSVDDPDKGSFRSYAKKEFGRWVGFSNGWVYLLSEMLIGKMMILGLTVIYVLSIALALALVSWKTIKIEESPFITALENFQLPYVTDIFNGILIIAGFSTMVVSLYAVLTIVTSLAEDHDAPAILAKKGEMKVPLPTILFLTGGLLITILIGFLSPEKIFEYMITAVGLMLLYNWFFILVTYAKLMNLSIWERVKIMIGMLLIVITVSGTLGEKTSRLGLYVSLFFIVIIGIATFIRVKKWGSNKLA